jgi:hypothetical protein
MKASGRRPLTYRQICMDGRALEAKPAVHRQRPVRETRFRQFIASPANRTIAAQKDRTFQVTVSARENLC